MSKYTNKTINEVLTKLRNDIRNGATIYDGKLKEAVYRAFAAAPGEVAVGEFFTTNNFNPQTLKRFETLFDVPNSAKAGFEGKLRLWPSQDDYAWALQNFMNRRKDPWAHARSSRPVDELGAITVTI